MSLFQVNRNKRKKILIVEDRRMNAQITADILSRYGYCVEVVGTGEEAIEKVKKENDIDLILMDIELGGKIDGIETTYLIQQFSDIPVLSQFTARRLPPL